MIPAPSPVQHLIDALEQRELDQAQAAALWQKHRGVWRRVSWADYALRVRRSARLLARFGVHDHARLAIAAEPSVHVLCLALAAHSLGADVCWVHPDGLPGELEAQWRAMAVSHVVAEQPAQRDLALEVGVHARLLTELEVNDEPGDDHGAMARLISEAGARPGRFVFAVEETDRSWRAWALDLTGLANAAQALRQRGAGVGSGQRSLCQLPFAHALEWLLGPVLHLLDGGELCLPESPDAVHQDLSQARVSRLSVQGWQLDALARRARHRLFSGGDRALRWLAPQPGIAGVVQRARVWPVLRRELGLAQVSHLIGHGPPPEAQTLSLMELLGVSPLWIDTRQVLGDQADLSGGAAVDAAAESLLASLRGHGLRSRQRCDREADALVVRIEIDPEAAGQFARERGLSYTTYRSLAALPALREAFLAHLSAPIEALRAQGVNVRLELLAERPERGNGGLRPDGTLAAGAGMSGDSTPELTQTELA